MRISDWSSDVCSSDLHASSFTQPGRAWPRGLWLLLHFQEDITMPAPSSAKPLYRIDECPDLMADGCVGDEQGNLVFLSIWARDTAVQEFLARLTRSEEHTSELQSLMRISYSVFCLKKKN